MSLQCLWNTDQVLKASIAHSVGERTQLTSNASIAIAYYLPSPLQITSTAFSFELVGHSNEYV